MLCVLYIKFRYIFYFESILCKCFALTVYESILDAFIQLETFGICPRYILIDTKLKQS